jgi:lipocalin
MKMGRQVTNTLQIAGELLQKATKKQASAKMHTSNYLTKWFEVCMLVVCQHNANTARI